MVPAQLSLSLLDIERFEQPQKNDPERIADIAARVIEDLNQEPPIPLEIVASYRDISDIEVVEMPQAGSLAPGPDNLVMRLRASDSLRRRRFTGFHEVGHTFQPGYREMQLFRCVDTSPAPRRAADPEALADVAASELLLPRAYFEPAALASPFAIESVVGLADTYEASVQATSYRFAAFWPEPTLVLTLEPGLRKEERDDLEAVAKLRVVSAWPHPHGAWPFIPRNKSADENGALVRALNGEVIREKAGLEELGLESMGNIELTARAFPYRQGGETRSRVLALFRRAGQSSG
jgi:IrrE N-terminal-like domain